MTRTTPLRARRLNLPGRPVPADEPDPAGPAGTDPLDPADDLLPAPPTEAGVSARLRAAQPVAVPSPEESGVARPGDEWEDLRQSGDRAAAAGRDAARPTVTRTLLELPLLLVVAALIAFFVRTFVAQAFYIPSESMTPQLQVYDRIVVSKLAYRLHEPRRGDIVVFDNPQPEPSTSEPQRSLPVRFIRGVGEAVGLVQPSTEEFIKRVIGLPGETVEGRDNTVYVNGRALVEPYLDANDPTFDFPAVTVPPDHLFVMGDNRDGSKDSRVFGPIKQSTVVGRTVVRVWPLGDASFL